MSLDTPKSVRGQLRGSVLRRGPGSQAGGREGRVPHSPTAVCPAVGPIPGSRWSCCVSGRGSRPGLSLELLCVWLWVPSRVGRCEPSCRGCRVALHGFLVLWSRWRSVRIGESLPCSVPTQGQAPQKQWHQQSLSLPRDVLDFTFVTEGHWRSLSWFWNSCLRPQHVSHARLAWGFPRHSEHMENVSLCKQLALLCFQGFSFICHVGVGWRDRVPQAGYSPRVCNGWDWAPGTQSRPCVAGTRGLALPMCGSTHLWVLTVPGLGP